MNDIYMNALREFHLKYDHYTAEIPHAPPQDVIELRSRLIREEVEEFEDESRWLIDGGDDKSIKNCIILLADAISDILYVVFGTALAYGIPIEECFMEVHRSNMTKSTEKINGKTVKGPNWEPPNLKQFIDTTNFGEE